MSIEPMSYPGRFDAAGKFHPKDPGAFRHAGVPFKGKAGLVTFEELKTTRSNRQNRAFFGIVVRAFCEHMGYRFANARDKEFVKDQILLGVGHYTVRKGLGGREVHEAMPTHNMDPRAFKELYEACQELGAQEGLVIPDPESPVALGAKG